MHFAVPQDTLQQDTPQQDTLQQDTPQAVHPADGPEPSVAKQRASATAILLAMALGVAATKAHTIETPALASHQAAQNSQNSDVTTPVKIIAPEFCKDQTWPYIDSRCLRRVDNTAPPATKPRIVEPPANTTATVPAPNDVTVNTIAANTISASTASTTAEASPAANQDGNGTAAAPVSLAASANNPADSSSQVMQSVFPTTEPGAANESGAQRSDVASYQRTSDGSQRHQHWNRHSNFFGFHF
jgi:hypothetical protein